MADSTSEFWRKLAAEFRAINRSETSYTWALFGTDLEMQVNFEDSDIGRSTKAQFEALCTDAGLKLKSDAVNPWSIWLAALKHESPNDLPGEGSAWRNGVLCKSQTGRINNPCLASANLCHVLQAGARRLEQQTIQAEFARQIDDFTKRNEQTEIEFEAQKRLAIEQKVEELRLKARSGLPTSELPQREPPKQEPFRHESEDAPFPRRAAWFRERLNERGWDHNTLEQHNGPDHKTNLKILAGRKVIPKVLTKVVMGLNSHRDAPRIKYSSIPTD
jgi:hypothetical protein